MDAAFLTIPIGNVAAHRVHEHAGFSVDGEKRHRDFEAALGAPGFMRMVREYGGVATILGCICMD
jgi:hypothetical protein